MTGDKLKIKAHVPVELREHVQYLVVYLRRHDNRWSFSKLVVLGLILAFKEIAPRKRRGQYVIDPKRCNELMEKILKQT
jgi:hypothetical protein